MYEMYEKKQLVKFSRVCQERKKVTVLQDDQNLLEGKSMVVINTGSLF